MYLCSLVPMHCLVLPLVSLLWRDGGNLLGKLVIYKQSTATFFIFSIAPCCWPFLSTFPPPLLFLELSSYDPSIFAEQSLYLKVIWYGRRVWCNRRYISNHQWLSSSGRRATKEICRSHCNIVKSL